MNISIDHEIIWLAPERTATSITKKILENFNFFTSKEVNQYEFIKLSDDKQSHDNLISDEYKNYKILTNIRNPYDRVFGCYCKFYLEKPLTKKTTNVRQKFNLWLKNTFLNHGYEVFLNELYSDGPNFLNKWKFEDVNPDYTIKVENIFEDILKLPFINDKSKEFQEFIRNNLKSNPYINKRYFDFDDLYDFETAKLVYHFYKPIFYKFGYDPFSFTKENLNEDQMVSFIHGNLE